MKSMPINRIKIVLVERGKTNKWLAKKLGKNETTVSRWCTNDTQPSLETLVNIAHSLDEDVRLLLNSTKNNSQ